MIPIVGLLIRLSVCGLIKDRNSLHLALNFDLLKTHSYLVSAFTVSINVALSYDFYKRLIEIICLSVFLCTEQKAADDCTGTV